MCFEFLTTGTSAARYSPDRRPDDITIHLWHNRMAMKKTLNVNDELFQEAKIASGAATDTETVRLGLQALVRRAAYERLRALRGTEPHAQDTPRLREKPAKRRNA